MLEIIQRNDSTQTPDFSSNLISVKMNWSHTPDIFLDAGRNDQKSIEVEVLSKD